MNGDDWQKRRRLAIAGGTDEIRRRAVARLVGAYETPGVAKAEAAAWVGLARTLLNLDEFLTRE